MKKKLIHYGEIFAFAFAVTALANVDNLLNAHGLDAWKSAVIALVIAGAKAGFDAIKATVGNATTTTT